MGINRSLSSEAVPLGDRLAYRVSEVATLVGLSRSKTYLLIASGELPSVKIGGSRRVPADALRQWLARQAATAAA